MKIIKSVILRIDQKRREDRELMRDKEMKDIATKYGANSDGKLNYQLDINNINHNFEVLFQLPTEENLENCDNIVIDASLYGDKYHVYGDKYHDGRYDSHDGRTEQKLKDLVNNMGVKNINMKKIIFAFNSPESPEDKKNPERVQQIVGEVMKDVYTRSYGGIRVPYSMFLANNPVEAKQEFVKSQSEGLDNVAGFQNLPEAEFRKRINDFIIPKEFATTAELTKAFLSSYKTSKFSNSKKNAQLLELRQSFVSLCFLNDVENLDRAVLKIHKEMLGSQTGKQKETLKSGDSKMQDFIVDYVEMNKERLKTLETDTVKGFKSPEASHEKTREPPSRPSKPLPTASGWAKGSPADTRHAFMPSHQIGHPVRFSREDIFSPQTVGFMNSMDSLKQLSFDYLGRLGNLLGTENRKSLSDYEIKYLTNITKDLTELVKKIDNITKKEVILIDAHKHKRSATGDNHPEFVKLHEKRQDFVVEAEKIHREWDKNNKNRILNPTSTDLIEKCENRVDSQAKHGFKKK